MALSTHNRQFLGGTSRWRINGRYTAQALTGVQRYAQEIVRALAEETSHPGAANRASLDLRVTVPASQSAQAAAHDRSPTPTSRIGLEPFGLGRGHLWEQLVLPFAPADGLLCLANTGPLLSRAQILCIHDTNVVDFPGSYSRAFRLWYRMLQPALARRVAALTTVSEASAAALRRHGIGRRDRDITVLPNGHEHVYRWRADRSRLFVDAAPARPFVFVLGSRAVHKNLALVKRIASDIDRLGLDIYVSGRADASFAATSDSDGATPGNVKNLGYVSDDDLALLYRHATCLLFPSFVEGFGLPLVEAMALGCPIISSSASCMPEIVRKAGLLAAPDDPVQWLAHLRRLHGSASLRAELIGSGSERARAYSWKTSAAGYRELMTRVGLQGAQLAT